MAAAATTFPAAAAPFEAPAHHSGRSGAGSTAEGGEHVPSESAWPRRHAGHPNLDDCSSTEREFASKIAQSAHAWKNHQVQKERYAG